MRVTVKTTIGKVLFISNAKRILCKSENQPNITVRQVPDTNRFAAAVNVGWGDVQFFEAKTPAKAYAKAVDQAWA